MARRRKRDWSAGLAGAPWWAIAVMVVGVIVLTVGVPIAFGRGDLDEAEVTRMNAAAAERQASEPEPQ